MKRASSSRCTRPARCPAQLLDRGNAAFSQFRQPAPCPPPGDSARRPSPARAAAHVRNMRRLDPSHCGQVAPARLRCDGCRWAPGADHVRSGRPPGDAARGRLAKTMAGTVSGLPRRRGDDAQAGWSDSAPCTLKWRGSQTPSRVPRVRGGPYFECFIARPRGVQQCHRRPFRRPDERPSTAPAPNRLSPIPVSLPVYRTLRFAPANRTRKLVVRKHQ